MIMLQQVLNASRPCILYQITVIASSGFTWGIEVEPSVVCYLSCSNFLIEVQSVTHNMNKV
jgi:hypothetical protein